MTEQTQEGMNWGTTEKPYIVKPMNRLEQLLVKASFGVAVGTYVVNSVVSDANNIWMYGYSLAAALLAVPVITHKNRTVRENMDYRELKK